MFAGSHTGDKRSLEEAWTLLVASKQHKFKFGGGLRSSCGGIASLVTLDIRRTSLVVTQSVGLRSRLVVI